MRHVRKALLRALALLPVASIAFAAQQALALDGHQIERNGKIERSGGSASSGG